MGKSKVISISAPADLIEFCIEHELSPSELFQHSALQQKTLWDRAHMDSEKLQKVIQLLQAQCEQLWEFLHYKGLETEFNLFRQEHGINQLA